MFSTFTQDGTPGPSGPAHVLPDGPKLSTKDGRTFYMPDPAAVVEASRSALPALVDIDHAAQMRGDTKASGWIESLDYRPGEGIFAKVDWLEDGAKAVRSREYRFTSAVVEHDEHGVINRIVGMALTNTPAMPVQQLAMFTAIHSPLPDAAALGAQVKALTSQVANLSGGKPAPASPLMSAPPSPGIAQFSAKVVARLRAKGFTDERIATLAKVDPRSGGDASKLTPDEVELIRKQPRLTPGKVTCEFREPKNVEFGPTCRIVHTGR